MLTDFTSALAAPLLIQDAQPSVPGMPGGGGTTGQPADGGATPGGATPPGSGGGMSGMFMLLLLVGMFVLMMVLSGSARKKEERKKAQLLSSLKKHDKVQTIGGVIGMISEIRGDEVVLKVDDAGATKICFAKSAVQQVLREGVGSPSEPQDTEASEPELASAAN